MSTETLMDKAGFSFPKDCSPRAREARKQEALAAGKVKPLPNVQQPTDWPELTVVYWDLDDPATPVYRCQVEDLGDCATIRLPDGQQGTFRAYTRSGDQPTVLKSVDYQIVHSYEKRPMVQIVGYGLKDGLTPSFSGCPCLHIDIK